MTLGIKKPVSSVIMQRAIMIMLNVDMLSIEIYIFCAECRYAECRDALTKANERLKPF